MLAQPASSAAAFRRALLLLPLTVVLAACDSDGPAAPVPIDASWTTTADAFRRQVDRRVTYVCPPNGVASYAWGTDIYTDDSSVCTAAVHAGKITLAEGGEVTFQMRPGQASYTGTTRNGVTTENWGPWDSSFIFP